MKSRDRHDYSMANMNHQRILAQHCKDNILLIPNALFNMRDVTPMLYDDYSSIFYKDLEEDLINIEFHTQTPCIVFIKAGKEVITTSENRVFEVSKGEAIFLPKGLNLYSDYIHEGEGLNAYLLFFGSDVLSSYLSKIQIQTVPIPNEEAIFTIKTNQIVDEYFSSLHSVYESLNNSPHLLRLKLLELLHLLGIHDDGSLIKYLLSVQRGNAKRNIRRLMEQYALSDLTAKELAALSGRSVSTFNREFKALYGTTPKQWLIDKRMDQAFTLLQKKQWSVTAVAVEVGYNNISHFIEAFKKKYGKTPHQIKSEE
jgi:AraC-like DNA-binding protein